MSETKTELNLAVGQVWESKRDRHRTVTITHVYPGGGFGVRRNTSRRTQAIAPATLRKDYRLKSEAPPKPDRLSLITIQQGVGRGTYRTHLAYPHEMGGTGPTLCPWDRHAPDGGGWSVGGGTSGGNTVDEPCPECVAVARELKPAPTIAGMRWSRDLMVAAVGLDGAS